MLNPTFWNHLFMESWLCLQISINSYCVTALHRTYTHMCICKCVYSFRGVFTVTAPSPLDWGTVNWTDEVSKTQAGLPNDFHRGGSHNRVALVGRMLPADATKLYTSTSILYRQPRRGSAPHHATNPTSPAARVWPNFLCIKRNSDIAESHQERAERGRRSSSVLVL